jgi:hypothetical protein
MELWLKKSIELVESSIEDLNQVDYKDMICLFYDYFSNRNLAQFISYLFNKDVNDLYFEIDEIIAGKNYDMDKVEKILLLLKENGFDEWLESD